MLKTLIAATLVAFAGTGSALAAAEPGKPAPAFTLSDTKGTQHNLADFKGKTVILEWTNHDCPYVRKHYDSGNLQTLQKDATSDGAIWLTIISSAEGKQGYVTPEQGLEISKKDGSHETAKLLDTTGKVGREYGAKTSPHMFVIDPNGTIVYAGGIDSIKTANKDDIPKATNYVRAALEALKAGKPVETSAAAPYGCSIKYGDAS